MVRVMIYVFFLISFHRKKSELLDIFLRVVAVDIESCAQMCTRRRLCQRELCR